VEGGHITPAGELQGNPGLLQENLHFSVPELAIHASHVDDVNDFAKGGSPHSVALATDTDLI
jgi:hypothetical protein